MIEVRYIPLSKKCEEILEICKKIKEKEYERMKIASEKKEAYDVSVVGWAQAIEMICLAEFHREEEKTKTEIPTNKKTPLP